MDKLRISPSSIKAYWEYVEKNECGLLYEELYISRTGIRKTPTEKMMIGTRFEHLVTGAVNRDGTVPSEILTPTGKLSSKNKIIEIQVERAKKALVDNGFEITAVQKEVIADFGTYELKNIIDIEAIKDEAICIIDLKTSGLLNDKWADWGWSPERLHQKKKLLIQAACNIISAREVWMQEVIPYYFYVASNSNDTDAAFFKMHFTETALAEYMDLIEDAAIGIEVESELGFRAFPDHKRCAKCPMKDRCSSFLDTPKMTNILIETANIKF